jgi:tetratricopeptide (TPR) repeat protein
MKHWLFPAALTWLALAGPCFAYDDPESAIQALANRKVTNKEQLDSAAQRIDAAAAREPSNNRWQFGKVLLLEARGEALKARDLMEEVVEREPKSAEYQAWFGETIFNAIDETGMLTKLSWGLKGRGALEKAVELDPNHVMAQRGLVDFYSQAPAIAGGSKDKAETHAKALLAIPEGKGEFAGRMALAKLAAAREDWVEMDRQYTLAETAKGDGANPRAAMTTNALLLLQKAKDPKKALAIAERLAQQAPPDDMTPSYLLGEAQRQLGDCKAALTQFESVLAKRPEAQNSRFGAAACYEKVGDKAKAATNYEEFARRFPKDERASEASAAAKRLRKAS